MVYEVFCQQTHILGKDINCLSVDIRQTEDIYGQNKQTHSYYPSPINVINSNLNQLYVRDQLLCIILSDQIFRKVQFGVSGRKATNCRKVSPATCLLCNHI